VHTGLWKEDLKERDHIKDKGIDVRIILKWDLNRVGWRSLYWSGSELRKFVKCGGHGKECSGSAKCRDFF
jgi:hypothetical protein